MTLKDLKIGERALVSSVLGAGANRQHLLDMGVIPGATVEIVKFAPMGDPVEVEVAGYELTLRLAEAEKVTVEPLKSEEKSGDTALPPPKTFTQIDHPGLGEEGIYHTENSLTPPIPKDAPLTLALIGNQNTGKTTLFNALTGSAQHVGNFPGVTIEAKSGFLKGLPNVSVTDTPGIYSLSPYSPEEVVTRNYLLGGGIDGVINIVDAANIERNLYLTMQLLELEIPVVVALNMMDEVTNNGGAILVNTLEKLLGTPVVAISANRGEGVEELIRHIRHVSRHHEAPTKIDYCGFADNGGAVHRALHSVMHLIADHAERAKLPIRFATEKLIEGDELVAKALKLDENELDAVGHITTQMEKERGLDKEAAVAAMRFNFIKRVTRQCVIKAKKSREKDKSLAIDKVLTGKYTALPIFVAIMALVFFLTFNVIGAAGESLLKALFDKVGGLLNFAFDAINAPKFLKGLVVEGVFNGVSSVVSFLPIIVTLFFFLSMLEDLGYMARVAFVMDKALRKVGLSGRSIVPLLVGFGCTVPAVMAARTLPSDRDRKLTILLTPFMSCSAKLPIYAFFSAAFFPKYAPAVMLALYLGGIFLGIVAALIYGKTKFRGEAAPFVMELPNYRIPSAKNIALLLWEKVKGFLHRAFTVILAATVVIWLLSSFNLRLEFVEQVDQSILGSLAGLVAPIFLPLGLADARIITSLITGFLAKETVVATASVLFGSTETLLASITTLAAVNLLVFCLLYTPCVAACAVIKREMGFKWGVFITIGQTLIAYAVAFLVNIVGVLILR